MTAQGVLSEKLITAPNGLDLTDFKPCNNAIKMGSPHEENIPIQLVTVGNLVRAKGHEFLIRSLAHALSDLDRSIELHIAGVGPELKRLENLIETTGLQKKVFLHGYIKDIPQFLNGKDIYVHSSFSESFGIAILEAMAARLCIVATKVGGVPDIIEHQKNGILIDYGDTESLVENLQNLIKSRELRDKLAFNARKTVEERFSITGTIRIYQSVYEDLLDQ